MEYTISQVYPADRRGLAAVDRLLAQEGLLRDKNLDYICAAQDESGEIIGTGACFGSTLRCFAVSAAHRGEGILNRIVSHLMEVQAARGNFRLFLCTKISAEKFFADIGFYEIARVENTLVFMENRRNGFDDYLAGLAKTRGEGRSGAIVMNANPFTLGHRYLIERAAADCDVLHLFVVSEEAGPIPAAVRRELVRQGTEDLPNVILHETGPYLISKATFPSYFLKEEAAVIRGHARLDAAVFERIAAALNIGVRYAGEEPFSLVTGLYDKVLAEALPQAGIEFAVLPRLETDGKPVSASDARLALKAGDFETLKRLVPETTFRYFASPAAAPVLERIRNEENVVHY